MSAPLFAPLPILRVPGRCPKVVPLTIPEGVPNLTPHQVGAMMRCRRIAGSAGTVAGLALRRRGEEAGFEARSADRGHAARRNPDQAGG